VSSEVLQLVTGRPHADCTFRMQIKAEFYVLLTVHPGMILVNNEFDAQFFLVRLFLFSTCFGQPCAHHQENYFINATPGLCHSV
jgi:hypothetical protein